MFYEDIRVGERAALGQTEFSREAILAYGKRFDPRIVAQAAEGRARLVAAGMHVAAAGMRQLVDARSALRVAMAERGETLPQLGVSPGFNRQEPRLSEMLKWHDAALLIGDPALQAKIEGYRIYDLAEQWRRWTGRPFVFAFWAVRKAALDGAWDVNLADVFQRSRDRGLRHIPEIVSAWAPRLGLPSRLVADYLEHNVDYSLDQENMEGLRLFFRYAAECQTLPPAPEIEFLDQPRLAARS